MADKPWGGRFQEATDPRVEAFTASIAVDSRLADADIRGSIAHARMLSEVGLLTRDECEKIVAALEQIGCEIQAGRLPFRQELEDIHMHIESALIERLGDVGRKLHTGRSRNDQVSTDLRLYVRDAAAKLDGLLADVQAAFVARGEVDMDVVVPAYTHLQRAQPVFVVHFWLAYVEKFQRDRDRLQDCLKRVNQSPLGAAALAGTTLPIDRESTARSLGFSGVIANSLDASGDRDFVAEFVFVLSLIATHLSGWAEEWILWCSTEFGYLKLPDRFTTGSSIMPQKRNPDVLELIRGKSARAISAVGHILTLLKGLPLAYNRDLQEDKIALFGALDTVTECLEIAPALIAQAELQTARIAERLDEGFLDATALLEHLIRQGVPMRTGHETVGKLVALCDSRGCRLADLPLDDFRAACDRVGEDVYRILGSRNAAQALSSYGSGGPDAVREQLGRWRAILKR